MLFHIHNVVGNEVRRSVSCAAIAAVIAFAPTSVYAQEATEAAPTAVQTGSGSSSANVDNMQGDIIVTAQFRSESVQRTPLSITAISGDMLRQRNFSSITDIARSVPNVTMAQGSGIRSGGQMFIRGIGQNDNNFALEPGVGTYVDDVYYGTAYGSAFDLIDVERVEVLRGPQGTLAGGNSIGGAVKLFSQKPTGSDTGYFEAGYGSNKQVNLRGAFDLALVPDTLMLRVSGGLRSDDGYVRRLDFTCDKPALAGKLPHGNNKVDDCQLGREGGQNVKALRAALRWVPSSNIEVNLSADYTRHDDQPGADVLIAVATANVSPVYQAQQMALYGVQMDTRFIPTKKYVSYATFADIPARNLILDPASHSSSWGVTNTIDWTIAPHLTLKSITAYRSVSGDYAGDVDASPLNFNTEYFSQAHRQFTQEVRLNGAIGDLVDWTVGGFYYNAHDRSKGTVDSQNGVPQFGGVFFQQNDPVTNRSYAGFATGVVHVADGLNVTGGYRYTDTRKVYTFSRFDPNPNGAIYVLGIDKLGRSPATVFSRSDFRGSIDYNVTNNFRVYASVTTGFKGGGVNPRPSTPAQQTPLYPEKLTNYETGFKSELFDRRLRLNGAAFLAKYKDLQVSARSLDLNGVLATLFSNVGEATIKGLELEAQGEPVRDLVFNASGSYLHFRYDDLGAAANVPNGPCITCKPIMTPTWKWNAGVQYQFDLGDQGSLTPRVDADYMSKAYSDPSNHSYTAIPARTVFNGRLTWRSAGDPKWEASLQVSNLFDKYYYAVVNDYIGSSQVATAQPGRPREFLFSVRRNF